ncbi:MAG TPA: DUF1800 domain-containing protein [Bryobacteraceae bacterium]|jgi:uncharacterized protein (DUF1800 family)
MSKILAFLAFVSSPALLPAQPAKPEAKYSQFEKKPGDRRILHALNRLTYGPRPGDLEAVKKMGVSEWIDLQLHPERIPENQALTSLVEPLLQSSNQVRIGAGGVVFIMAPGRMGMAPGNLLTQEKIRLLRQGTDKEALAFLATLPRDKVVQVLSAMPAVRTRLLPKLDTDLRRKVSAVAPPIFRQPESGAAQAKLFQAIQSDRQLEEVLTDFWFNHFNVDAGKSAVGSMLAAYERDAIRPHVLGKFRDLLGATANSAAMMVYLDNWQSGVASADPPPPQSQSSPPPPPPPQPRTLRLQLPGLVALRALPHGLNENYARELMELHTLGVNGGYTQKDIIEVARCFTGWTLENLAPALNSPFARFVDAKFEFNDKIHDKGEKTVLGATIPAGGGKEDGERVLDILARHPSTARFISTELAQRFVADDPPPALIDRMAAVFRSTDGDIRAVLAAMFGSTEFFSEGAYRSKVKTPLELVVSAVRATGAKVDDTSELVSEIATMGQPLYRKVEPTGYSNLGSKWVSSASLVERMNFALQLAQDRISGAKVDRDKLPKTPDTAARRFLFADGDKQTIDAIAAAVKGDSEPDGGLIAGMLLSSPEFQRK